jgi:ATP-dependent 26S proteasome regulatory subunit
MTSERLNSHKPELTVSCGDSRAEVFNMQGILADAKKGKVILHDASEGFELPIELVTIGMEHVKLPSGESAFSHTGTIKLADSEQETPNVMAGVIERYGKEPGIGKTKNFNMFELQQGDSKMLVVVDRVNKEIKVSDHFDRKDHPLYPAAEKAADQKKTLSSFLSGLMQAVDIVDASANDLYDVVDSKHLYVIGKDRIVVAAPKLEESHSISSESPISFEDIDGLSYSKAKLHSMAVASRHPEIMEKWDARPPKRVLLYGPEGTGKNMLAKALTHEVGGELWKLDGTDLYGSNMGDSERKIAEVFDNARKSEEPVVLLFRDLDSLIGAPKEAPSSAGGYSTVNAVAGIFKKEMNALAEENPHVLVVATTEDKDKVNPTLLGSSIFDYKIEVPLPTPEVRKDIISGIIAKSEAKIIDDEHAIYGNIDARALSLATEGMSGGDMVGIFRKLRFDKAIKEAEGEAVGPILQQDVVNAIGEFNKIRDRDRS